MMRWSTAYRGVAIGASAVTAAVAFAVAPASAQIQELSTPFFGSAPNPWGAFQSGAGYCAQATAWSARKYKLGIFDIKAHDVYAAATPSRTRPTDLAGRYDPNQASGLDIQVDVSVGFGTRVMVDKWPGTGPIPCAAYAQADGKDLDGNLILGVLSFKVGGGINTSVRVAPGKPVTFGGGYGGGGIDKGGLISLVKNEQVLVDANAQPASGLSPQTAWGGYINGSHFTLLGGAAIDLTFAHAAVWVDRRYRPTPAIPECSYYPLPEYRCATAG